MVMVLLFLKKTFFLLAWFYLVSNLLPWNRQTHTGTSSTVTTQEAETEAIQSGKIFLGIPNSVGHLLKQDKVLEGFFLNASLTYNMQ